MPVIKTRKLPMPGLVAQPRYRLTLTMLRDGRVTASPKNMRLYDSPSSLKLVNLFSCPDGQASLPQSVLAAALTGTFFAIGFDNDPADPLVRGSLITINESADLRYNVFGGSSEGGAPASVSVKVRVDGIDQNRPCVGIERQADGQWRVAGSAVLADGEMAVTMTDGALFLMAIDDVGTVFQPSITVAVGDRIRSPQFAGWLYRITEAGTLPASEPAWWPIDGDNAPRPLGSARAVAVRYYRPLAHGPVPVEMI